MKKYNFDEQINRLHTNSIKWDLYPEGTIPLWVADTDFRVSEPILEALHKKLDHGVLGYERLSRKLQEVIADRMDRLYSWKISPESVIGIPGILPGIYLSTRALCKRGNGIIVETPCYPPFMRVHETNHLKLKLTPMLSKRQGNILTYRTDWDLVEDLFKQDKTDMFLLCSPHNPTGITYSKKDLLRLAELCLENKTIICADEVFGEMLMGDAQHIPIASLDKNIEAQTITFIGAAKQYNIPGLMPAFVIIPNEKLRTAFVEQMTVEAMRINSFGIKAAEVAYSPQCDDWLEHMRAYLKSNRDALIDFMQTNLPEVATTKPDASFLSWLDLSQLENKWSSKGTPAEFLLEKAKIGLYDGKVFGPGQKAFVRFNTGCTRATLDEAMQRMANAFR